MYNHANPIIELGEMFGIFANRNDYVAISNKIFEIYLYNYSISVMQLQKENPLSNTTKDILEVVV